MTSGNVVKVLSLCVVAGRAPWVPATAALRPLRVSIVVLRSFDNGGVGAPRFPPSAVFTGTFFTGVPLGLLLVIFQRCRLMR